MLCRVIECDCFHEYILLTDCEHKVDLRRELPMCLQYSRTDGIIRLVDDIEEQLGLASVVEHSGFVNLAPRVTQ
jgi:hypothetical protein